MSRSARLHFPGGVFHIISRCLNREFLLHGAEERACYLLMLEKASRRTDARVLAWCVMSNHIHLVVRAGDEPLSQLMKRVNTGYARWKNARDRRLGPLFAERYKAILVEQETYLLELVRYVHLNPIRAGLVDHPDEDRCSSHRVYAGLDRKKPAWLDTRFVLQDFGKTRGEQVRAYRAFIDDGLESTVRSPVFSGTEWSEVAREAWRTTGSDVSVSDPIVGSEEWTAGILQELRRKSKGEEAETNQGTGGGRTERRRERPTLDALVDLICDVLDVDDAVFELRPKTRGARFARQVLTRIWIEDYRRTQLELSRLMKVHRVLVSRWYSRAVERIAEQHDAVSEVRRRLPEIEAPLELTSGQRVVPQKEAVRSSFHVEVIDERTELVSDETE